jgi:hypothetical protein
VLREASPREVWQPVEFRNNRVQPTVLQAGGHKKVIEIYLIDMVRASGMTAILDGKTGWEEYQSVCSSLSALQRFAEAVRHSEAGSKGNPNRVR